jgi:benzoyl-CoA reductase/2-hydroxyglutaryl-CoA dehydratase subunit BcrC/BadD/HgdB
MKKILYTCSFVPAEWIAAYGLQPCRVVPHAGKIDSTVSCVEGICPYVRGFINEPAIVKDDCAVVATTACDQMRRGFDIIVSQFDKPAFLMNVPCMWQTISAQKLYADELKRLGRFLIQIGGQKPTNSTLAKTMLKYDEARRTLLQSRQSMSALNFAEAVAAFGQNGPSVQIHNYTHHDLNSRKIPLAVIGGPLLRQDFEILQMAEQAGGRIVLDATETGERGLCPLFDRRNLQDNPLTELINAYFCGIYDARRRPNSELYKWLKHEIEARKVRGIVFHRNLWCDLWHAELGRLKEWTKLPVLDIDSTGENKLDQPRNLNRIHAFLEMLQ